MPSNTLVSYPHYATEALWLEAPSLIRSDFKTGTLPSPIPFQMMEGKFSVLGLILGPQPLTTATIDGSRLQRTPRSKARARGFFTKFAR